MSSTVTSRPPTLPTELIEEILYHAKLSKRDLAQCCLVARQFLPSSRKVRYFKLELGYSPSNAISLKGSSIKLWCPTESSRLLLRTLEHNATLRTIRSVSNVVTKASSRKSLTDTGKRTRSSKFSASSQMFNISSSTIMVRRLRQNVFFFFFFFVCETLHSGIYLPSFVSTLSTLNNAVVL